MPRGGTKQSTGAVIHWFRKGLRLHDNPALLKACAEGATLYPLFIMDPKFTSPTTVADGSAAQSGGLMNGNRHHFLRQCLQDLDASLEGIGSRLFVAQGKPELVLPALVKEWGVSLVTYEGDTGPYSKLRDAAVTEQIAKLGCATHVETTHTLFPMTEWVDKCGPAGAPKSYGSFCQMFNSFGKPRLPVPAPTRSDVATPFTSVPPQFAVPAPEATTNGGPQKFPGGETEALRRLRTSVIERPSWVASFDKPTTSPNSLEPSTTVLGPYLTLGCLSVATFWHEICKCKPKTSPPQSLHGQLLWREYFYLCSATTSNFDRMQGNALCRQIPWQRDVALIEAWKQGRTGFPWIDAIMTQLQAEGWIHHLARHAVACFLTRGDLWQHWEEGAKHFEYSLLDGDWAINNANWQWLSCSRFFHQYGRCYSPIAFGKKTDPEGLYIKKWLPALRKMPTQYIYEPWLAPANVQKAAKCIVGKDYPNPLVDHATASKENTNRMSVAFKGGVGLAPEPIPAGGGATARAGKATTTTGKKLGKHEQAAKGQMKIDKFLAKKPVRATSTGGAVTNAAASTADDPSAAYTRGKRSRSNSPKKKK